ncbi:hypothetical protein B9Z55_000170 [Caenorhabditis nigoni]|uniref:F-box domain-containing protein n=1 Tax=Caenorhabditis nigoni TaxID=1611254 RepID=A0A2G5VH10_9PELO|nr:hypothetical protein B9Z55_000170 [Caenorhabditis nigoni]
MTSTITEEVPKTLPKQQLLHELSQTVFEYMDPSFRFHLSLHLPSLRSIERRTHLHIDKLFFYDNEINVNETMYKLSIDLKYEIEKPPSRISGTVYRDVDEFGFETITEDYMMNGDVFINNYRVSIAVEFGRLRLEDEASVLMETIKKKEPPEFKSILKLTITPKDGEPRIYKSSEIVTIYEGMKMLIAAIFGSRTVIWTVEYMQIWTRSLRWIVSGVKPFARNIQLLRQYSVNSNSLRLICHPTSFPLKNLRLELTYHVLDQEVLLDAENVLFYSCSTTWNVSLMSQLVKISHLKVQIFRISKYVFADLMHFWLQHEKPVGTNPSKWQWDHPQYYPFPMVTQYTMIMLTDE